MYRHVSPSTRALAHIMSCDGDANVDMHTWRKKKKKGGGGGEEGEGAGKGGGGREGA